MVGTMKSKRAKQASALGNWAKRVRASDLVEIDTDELKAIAQYAQRRDFLDRALTEAICTARRNGRSWAQIGTMLGVSKQAAQRKYAKFTREVRN